MIRFQIFLIIKNELDQTSKSGFKGQSSNMIPFHRYLKEGTLINKDEKKKKKGKTKGKKKVDETKKLKFLKLTKREEEAMRKPELYRCKNCGEVFRSSQGELIRENSEGYFYCYKCLESMKKKKKSH